MNTTVPADVPCGPAVAAGPTTRLAAMTSAPTRSKIERLRMYSLHPSGALRLQDPTDTRPTRPGPRVGVRRPRTSRSGCLHRRDQVQDHTSVTSCFKFG